MAALGALVGAGVLAVIFSARGVALFPSLPKALHTLRQRTERFTLWLVGALCAAAVVWALTDWPVAGLWILAAVLSVPLLRDPGVDIDVEIDTVEAIATWTEQVRDTMSASSGLQQALVATSSQGPAAIADELAAFARRAPRGDLGGSLRQLGADLAHPSADMVIAGLIAAADLNAGRLVPLLTRLASSIRDEAQMRVRVEVGRARVRTSMKIVGFFVCLTTLLLVVAGGDLLRGYDTVAGQIWLLVVGGFVVLAVWSSRRLSAVSQPERFVARGSAP